eukprot:TRINITY_DN21818_c0_g1_i1.p2 TRINITY_DN21818_c0_g1~~TRINITY_DN21818_c0_g1_i1.p2  ORF type:complete len:134 (-),score=20.89 TRINITY_DN21818_c0_g1_i1:125-526(-)
MVVGFIDRAKEKAKEKASDFASKAKETVEKKVEDTKGPRRGGGTYKTQEVERARTDVPQKVKRENSTESPLTSNMQGRAKTMNASTLASSTKATFASIGATQQDSWYPDTATSARTNFLSAFCCSRVRASCGP